MIGWFSFEIFLQDEVDLAEQHIIEMEKEADKLMQPDSDILELFGSGDISDVRIFICKIVCIFNLLLILLLMFSSWSFISHYGLSAEL